MTFGGYPPPHHLLGDLGFEGEILSLERANLRMRVTPYITGADGGVRTGVLATLVDVVGGAVAMRAILPDWMATADLTLQMVRPATGPFVEARASVLRKGRTTLVVEAHVFNVSDDRSDPGGSDQGGDEPAPSLAAWATMTFAILPAEGGPGQIESLPDVPSRWTFGGAGLDRPVVEALGILLDTTGAPVSLPVQEYLLNSFGAVQGGVMALLGEVAGAEALGAARGLGGEAMVVTDLQIAYLALGRIGPIVTRARVLEAGPERRATGVIELVDEGGAGRVTTVINVSALAVPVPTRAAR